MLYIKKIIIIITVLNLTGCSALGMQPNKEPPKPNPTMEKLGLLLGIVGAAGAIKGGRSHSTGPFVAPQMSIVPGSQYSNHTVTSSGNTVTETWSSGYQMSGSSSS